MRVSKYEMDGHANANENAKLQFFLKNKASFAVCCCFSWNSHVHIQQDEGLMINHNHSKPYNYISNGECLEWTCLHISSYN